MLKIRRPLGRLIFNMGIAIPGKTVFLIETAPCCFWHTNPWLYQKCTTRHPADQKDVCTAKGSAYPQQSTNFISLHTSVDRPMMWLNRYNIKSHQPHSKILCQRQTTTYTHINLPSMRAWKQPLWHDWIYWRNIMFEINTYVKGYQLCHFYLTALRWVSFHADMGSMKTGELYHKQVRTGTNSYLVGFHSILTGT